MIAAAYADDDSAAQAEYGAEFRPDIEAFFTREAIEAVVVPNRFELPPMADTRYFAFTDPSGGSADAFTLAIAHRDESTASAVIDVLREVKPPFSPEAVVADFCALLKCYHVYSVTGDRYGGEWPREQFRKNGLSYHVAERPASDLFRDALPAINAGRVELLDHRGSLPTDSIGTTHVADWQGRDWASTRSSPARRPRCGSLRSDSRCQQSRVEADDDRARLGLRQSATARASCGLERLLARVEGLEGGEMSKGDWQGNLTGAAKILEKVALPAKRAASETTCAKLAGRMIEFGAQCETVGADASLSAVAGGEVGSVAVGRSLDRLRV